MKFIRTDLIDGTSEILTVAKSETLYFSMWLEEDSPYIVQVVWGQKVLGLFDLDGCAITNPHRWEIVEDSQVPAEVITAIEEGWSNGNCIIERQS